MSRWRQIATTAIITLLCSLLAYDVADHAGSSGGKLMMWAWVGALLGNAISVLLSPPGKHP